MLSSGMAARQWMEFFLNFENKFTSIDELLVTMIVLLFGINAY